MWSFNRKTSTAPRKPDACQHVLSLLDPAEVNARGGLPGEAIAGTYLDPAHTLESFRVNSVFVALLHRVIAAHSIVSPELAKAASGMNTGHLYIIDWRTPAPNGAVPPEDIIGAIEVKDGSLIPDSYKPNPNYRVLTGRGMTRLTPSQREAFVKALPTASGRDI
jgi:hypothetical protein